MKVNRPSQGRGEMTEFRGREKRRYARSRCDAGNRPQLVVGNFTFEVLDYSRDGIRILNPDSIHLDGWISGVLVTRRLGQVAVDAIVVRRRGGELGLHLVVPLADRSLEGKQCDDVPAGD